MRQRAAALGLVALAALGTLAALGRAANKTKLDPESERFYLSARLIMTKEEDKIFKRLPDAETRKEFIADFWEKRDPDPETPDNEFRTEFESRVAYANKRFKEGGRGMNTDRGRIYILMGPPDKFEEYLNHEETSSRGSILWWIYYDHQLGVELVDEKGDGSYRIRDITGDFFGAMEMNKLGQWVGPDSVFRKRIIDFDLKYDKPHGEIVVDIPAKSLLFKENDEGRLQVDLVFKFYVYEREGEGKTTFTEERSFAMPVREEETTKTVSFRFGWPLPPGKNFVDVLVSGKAKNSGKVRKIFEVKAAP